MAKINYERYQKFNKKIRDIKDGYTDIYIEYQKYFLNWLISYVHEAKIDGQNIKNIEKDIIDFPSNFILEILEPNINIFYLDRTRNLISKNKKILELHVESYLKEKRTINDECAYNFNENMDENIKCLIDASINWIFSSTNCRTTELKNLKEQYLNGCNDATFIKNMTNIIYKFHDSIQNKYYQQFIKKMNINCDILSNMLIKNIDNYVEVHQEEIIATINNEEKRVVIEDIKLKDTLNDVLYCSDDIKNCNIFIPYEFLPTLPRPLLKDLYHFIKSSNPNKKEALSEMFQKVIHSGKQEKPEILMDFKSLLCERIKNIANFLDELELLENYNDTNNERLDKLNIPELKFSYDELKNNLTDTVKLNSYSLEALLGLSSFYSNRATKCIDELCKAIFIFKKLNLFNKCYNDDSITLNSLNIDDNSLKEMCAQYDFITDIIEYNIINKFLNTDLLNEATDDDLSKEYDNLFNKYKDIYNAKYPDSFEKDYKHIITTSDSIINCLYLLKTQTTKSLIYSALKDNKKNIINWGYIDEHKLHSDKILLGFDIHSLNMPIKLHIKKEQLSRLFSSMGETPCIPYYVGSEDTHSRIGNISTQVLSVVSKDKKKEILKNTKTQSMFFNHIKWLQRPMDKPEYLKNIPEKFYNLDKTEPIEK